jgi:hypothetical protein
VWAGVDNAWEQEKPEARKMLVNRADSHTSGAPEKMGGPSFYTRETGCVVSRQGFDRLNHQLDNQRKYTPKRQARKPKKAMESILYDFRGAPWFPVKLI